MKSALVLGASGLVGSSLINQLLKDDYYNSIRILVRSKIDYNYPKIEQIIFDYENPQNNVVFANDVYCCLGTTIRKAGSKEAFKKVDYFYPLETAKTALQNGAEKFALVSSMGANKNSLIFYSRVKGEIEEALTQLHYPALYILRPSMLLGNRKEFRLGEIVGKGIFSVLSFLIPDKYKGVHADKVAAAMILNMKSGTTGIHIIESDVIQKSISKRFSSTL